MELLQLLSLCVNFLGVAGAPSKSDATIAVTSEGAVQGSLVNGVRQWLGIPYAADTSGSNRWKAPQPPPPFPPGETFQATAFGSPCPQYIDVSSREFIARIRLSPDFPDQSEDCLSLNIWSPSANRKQSTAVMIWIHGGSFQWGTSGIGFYNGQSLVQNNEDITIVTINYRMNIFNAPTAPQLQLHGGVGNFGLLDIDAAVSWVHQNMAAFGGDPSRIILFGESTGALAADAYAFAHPSDSIVKGIILESGTVFLDAILAPTENSPDDPKSHWNSVAKTVGCGTTPDVAQFSCMQAQPLKTLQSAIMSNEISFSIVRDGITFFADTSIRSSKGQFLKVPVLSGNNAHEADIIVVAVEEFYLNFTIPIATTALSDLVTKVFFTCPASRSTSDRVDAGVPTYRYRYHGILFSLFIADIPLTWSDQGVFPSTSNRTDLRAYHTAEIPMVFGTYRLSPLQAAPTANEIALSSYMQSAWVAFARNPASGLEGPGFDWPRYSPRLLNLVPTLAELGSTSNPGGVSFVLPAEVDASCHATTALFALLGGLMKALGIF